MQHIVILVLNEHFGLCLFFNESVRDNGVLFHKVVLALRQPERRRK